MGFSTSTSGDECAEEHAVEGGRMQGGNSDTFESVRNALDEADDFLFVVEERLELGSQELQRSKFP